MSGECLAVLENVGLSSYASKITLEAKSIEKKTADGDDAFS